MVLQSQVLPHLGLNKQQAYSQEQNCYSESSQGQMMRPSGYGYGGHGHGHGHGHNGSHGHHGHMPHGSTNYSSSTTMAHTDGRYGNGMQQSSHAHMSSSNMGMGSTNNHHGYGYGSSRPGQNTFTSNWAAKDLDD